MARTPIEEIKQKIDIVNLVSSYVPLKKAGRNFKALCPFHNEKTPSFMVSPELQIFKCFGCGLGGDILAFVKQIEGVEFSEALKILAAQAGVRLKGFKEGPQTQKRERLFRVNHLALEFYHYLLATHKVGKKARLYLRRRGVGKRAVEKFGLGYAPRSWDSLGKFLLSKKLSLSDLLAAGLVVQKEGGRDFYDRFRGRIVFPIKDVSGRVVGFSGRRLPDDKTVPKYINTPETVAFRKNRLLFGLDLAKVAIKKENLALVVEGQLDVITPFMAGTENIVASLGTALTFEQIRLLRRFCTNVALCFDADLAGDRAARRGVELAEEAGLAVRVLSLPTAFKDPDECVRTDPASWKKALSRLVPVYDFFLTSVLRKHNPREASGKKKILAEFLPILLGISSEVVRLHYIKKLAEELEVEERAVVFDFEKFKAGEGRTPLLSREAAVKTSPSRQQLLERKALRLPFLLPLKEAKAALRKLAAKDFTDPRRLELFVSIKKYFMARKRPVDVSIFRGRLKRNLGEFFEALYFTAEKETAVESLKEELVAVVSALKRQTLKRELRSLGLAIKRAEKEGREVELKKLKGLFSKVSTRLSQPF